MKLESRYKAGLKKKLRLMFPGCELLDTDPTQMQGLPDLIILFRNRWAALECKRAINSARRPNQDYYVKRFGEMSFASYICPDTEKEVLYELQQALDS